jgi:cell division protein FtsL
MKNFIYFSLIHLLLVVTCFAQQEVTTTSTHNENILEITETGSAELQRQALDKLYNRFNDKNTQTGILLDKYSFSKRVE